MNSLHFLTTWSVLIVRVSDGASSSATSAILDPAKLAFKLPGPLEVLVSIGKYPIVDNLFFIIFSSGNSVESWFSSKVAASSSFSKPSLVTSKGVPDAYSIVAIAKSSSTAGKKVNFKKPLARIPTVSINTPPANESAENGWFNAFSRNGL